MHNMCPLITVANSTGNSMVRPTPHKTASATFGLAGPGGSGRPQRPQKRASAGLRASQRWCGQRTSLT